MVQNSSPRGFAAMDPEKQRSIASKGGKAAHQQGKAHEFSSEEAREAGRKGGVSVSRNRAHMAAIGAQGGRNSHRSARVNSSSAAAPNQSPTSTESAMSSDSQSLN